MNKTTNDLNAQPTMRFTVPGSGSRSYTITVPGGGAPAYCSCPAWRFQKSSPDARTCKHLIRFKARFN
jgi:predicted nucleic acid-binding Zn finger protein